MKKNFKRWLAILAVFALMSVSIFSNASVSAKALEGDAEQQEETINQAETDTEISEISEVSGTEDIDEETDTEDDEEEEESCDDEDDNETGEDDEESEDTDEVTDTEEVSETEELSETDEVTEKIEEISEDKAEQNNSTNTEQPLLKEKMMKSGKLMMLGSSPEPPVKFVVSEGGTLEYKIGEGSWAVVPSEGLNTVPNGSIIYLKATPGSEKKIDDWSDGEKTQNFVECNDQSNTTYFSPEQLEKGTASFAYANGNNYRVKVAFVNNGGPGPAGDPGKYIVSISQEVSGRTGSISVQFFNGDSQVGGTAYYSDSVSDGILIPEGANSVKISVTAGSDILNNARLENRTDRDEADLIDDMRRDEVNHCSTQSIDISKAYEIRIAFSNTMSVSWTYNTSDSRRDMIVEHAKIELLNSDNATDYTDKGRTEWQLTVGETYYFVLIPDYGYQVSGLNINGQAIEPMNSVGVFKFVMSHSNFHLQGIVSEFDDIANKDGEMLGDISVDGAGAVDSGNVMISEKDLDPDTSALNAVTDSDAQVFGTMDLKLDQAISKGNGEFWTTQKDETNNPVNISVVIPAGELGAGEIYSIVRNHNGVYEELDATYDFDNETLSFASDKFSEYTIVKKHEKDTPTPTPTPTPTKAPEENSSEKTTGTTSSSSSENASVVPVTIPDTTVVATIGGTIVTQKDTKDNVAVMVGGTKSGVKISEWNELAAYLATPQTAPLTTQISQTETTGSGTPAKVGTSTSKIPLQSAKPIELVLCKKNTVVPEIVFDSLAVNPAHSLHIHIRDGVAINFFNNPNVVNQKAVDLKCTITAPKGYAKRIIFNSDAKLFAITSIHATVPKSIKSVNVYTVDKKGKRTLLWANVPVTDGRYCFLISQLGTFEIEY